MIAKPCRIHKCTICGTVFESSDGRPRKYCENCKEDAHRIKIKHPEMSTGTKGALTELMVCADLLIKGYEVFRSVSPTCSCDLIACKPGDLIRIEVRTANRSKAGELLFSKKIRAEVFAIVVLAEDKIIYLDKSLNTIDL